MVSDDLKDIEKLEKTKDKNWEIEEVLRSNNLLEKVSLWLTFKENLFKCPICEKEFQEGDLSIDYGIPIHTRCFRQLEKKE
jgi:hypothetical protein